MRAAPGGGGGKKVFQVTDEEIRRQVGRRSGLATAMPEDASRWTWRDVRGPRFDELKSAMEDQSG
jgi:hypothetical protein